MKGSVYWWWWWVEVESKIDWKEWCDILWEKKWKIWKNKVNFVNKVLISGCENLFNYLKYNDSIMILLYEIFVK